MQTIYYQTTHFIRHQNNVIDLQAYRYKRALAGQDDLSQAPLPPTEGETSRPDHIARTFAHPVRRSQAPRPMVVLDFCATLGIVVMTLTFTLCVLMG